MSDEEDSIEYNEEEVAAILAESSSSSDSEAYKDFKGSKGDRFESLEDSDQFDYLGDSDIDDQEALSKLQGKKEQKSKPKKMFPKENGSLKDQQKGLQAGKSSKSLQKLQKYSLE